jgi:hypothetical protein
MKVLFWRSIDGQEKSSGFVLCTFLFYFRTVIQNRWIPVQSEIHCISGFRIPLEYGRFQWIPVESDWCKRTRSVVLVHTVLYLLRIFNFALILLISLDPTCTPTCSG